MCITYILHSSSKGRYYIGHTCDDMEQRLRRHNSAHSGFTGGTDDWRVVFSQEFPSKKEAYAREREIKKWKSVKMVRALIEST